MKAFNILFMQNEILKAFSIYSRVTLKITLKRMTNTNKI